MGKTDDLRRLREAQHAQRESAIRAQSGSRAAAASVAAAAPAVASTPTAIELAIEAAVVARPKVATRGRAARVAKAAAADDTGTCASCHKSKPLKGGVIATHQKGLGKVCPGSRKPPA